LSKRDFLEKYFYGMSFKSFILSPLNDAEMISWTDKIKSQTFEEKKHLHTRKIFIFKRYKEVAKEYL